MNHRNAKSLLALALLLGTMVLCPVAQAGDTPDRNTGVGLLIAAQGNEALRLIREQFAASLHLAKPKLAKARVVKVSDPAPQPGPGGASSASSSVRCAE